MSFEPAAFDWKGFSQFGEDGITLELVKRVQAPHSFLEIGAGNGQENCTRILAEAGWTGTWIDADPGNCQRAAVIAEPLGVRVRCASVNAENAFGLRLARVVGVLSIDIDGNDYYVWRALCHGDQGLRPCVVVIEAQIQRPHDEPWVMPYDPAYVWDGTSHDCGASILSMVALGFDLGYTYVGRPANPHSPNLFFVRDDLVCRL